MAKQKKGGPTDTNYQATRLKFIKTYVLPVINNQHC